MTDNKVGAVLVVGGGIAGIQASLDLAEAGYYVYLAERKPAIGGTMPMLDKTFPTNDCSMCILSPKLVDCGRHINIETMTNAELLDVQGQPGDFTVTIHQRRRCVDLEKCTGCGDCAVVCPVELPNEFDVNLGKRKAIYKLYPQATPSAFAIDKRGTPPCRDACPAGVNAQGYIQLIRLGKYKEAWEIIYRDNPFPAICGRVCTHPCQDACHRNKIDSAVRIRELKRWVTDNTYNNPEELPLPEIKVRKEEKVAIVGSGPVGLSCAYHLAKKGYQVTVFEALGEAGGMLRLGIPSYRLPKEWVDLEIGLIKRLGVEIRLNSRLGRDFTIQSLFEEGHKAVFLAIGAHGKVGLGIPGEELAVHGVDFLRQAGQTGVNGRQVLVVGGGNVAMDVARTSIRLGASEVKVVCLEAREEMAASEEEVLMALEEGVTIHNSLGTKAIFSQEGKVTGIQTIAVDSVFDSEGYFNPIYIEGTESVLPAELVILAVGQRPDLSCMPEFSQSKRLPADPETYALDIPGVFAGGDAVSGPASVVVAIGAGKKAAASIDAYIQGQKFEGIFSKEKVAPLRFTPAEVEARSPLEAKHLEPGARITNFSEVSEGYTEEEARAEAERCLNCGVCAECLECERACLRKAIDHQAKDREIQLKVGAVILSPGFEVYQPGELDYYGYGFYPNVITSLELERILSASGPYQGHLVRPSDRKEPRRMAFIQCVGSRNVRIGKNYCSAACCMYTIKEAIISKEHSLDPLDTTVFYMDMRTYGKDFERYYERAKNEHGVRFIRSRIFAVEEVEGGDLRIRYADEDGNVKTETFDMVVLAVGLNPPSTVHELAAAAGVELDRYGFCKSQEFAHGCATREGIFASGVFMGPKDIPETVTEASAAAGYAARLLSSARGELAKVKVFPPERDVGRQKPRIGVFICNCGINIAGVINVPEVAAYAAKLKDVVHVEEFLFTCSQDSIERIKEVIKEQELNRVVVVSCTPRTHAPLFQSVMREVGLNPYLYEHVNIREHSSWVHRDWPEAATLKAQQLIKMATARVRLLYPITPSASAVEHSALVVGGGVAGMNAAISLAEQGFKVYLAEKSNLLGGNARHVFYALGAGDPQSMLSGLISKVEQNELIEVFLEAEILDAKGFPGNFVTSLMVGGEKREVTHGAVVIATGASEYRPDEYLYGQNKNVLTQRELEERLARGEVYNNVVMIQCVGSRQEERPYCSRVCCIQAIKNALKIKEMNPDANVFILYRDIRTYGLHEEFYTRARASGIIFIRYQPEEKPRVQAKMEKLEVRVRDHILQQELSIQPELVVLSAGIIPKEDNERLSQLFKVPLTEDGFFLEAHKKLRPVDFSVDGLYLCGLAHSPKLLEESIVQANAAAMRAVTLLAKERLDNVPITAVVDEELCTGCGLCIEVCDYNARFIDEESRKAKVIEALCQGCGACVAACPSGASQQKGFEKSQLFAMLEEAAL